MSAEDRCPRPKKHVSADVRAIAFFDFFDGSVVDERLLSSLLLTSHHLFFDIRSHFLGSISGRSCIIVCMSPAKSSTGGSCWTVSAPSASTGTTSSTQLIARGGWISRPLLFCSWLCVSWMALMLGPLHTTLAGKRLCIAGVDKDIFFRLECAERDFKRGQFLILNTRHAVEVLNACRHDGCFHLLVKRLSSNQDGLHAFGLSRWKNQDACHEMLPVHMALQTKETVLFSRKDGQDLWCATLCGDRACQVREMQARVRFVPCARNPLRRSRVSRARNAGESVICPACAQWQPSAEIVRVECAKCRRECGLSQPVPRARNRKRAGDGVVYNFSGRSRGVSGELEGELSSQTEELCALL